MFPEFVLAWLPDVGVSDSGGVETAVHWLRLVTAGDPPLSTASPPLTSLRLHTGDDATTCEKDEKRREREHEDLGTTGIPFRQCLQME